MHFKTRKSILTKVELVMKGSIVYWLSQFINCLIIKDNNKKQNGININITNTQKNSLTKKIIIKSLINNNKNHLK